MNLTSHAMSKKLILSASLFVLFLSSCIQKPASDQTMEENKSWEAILEDQIALLGHRNWVVVADAAYPLQSNPGIMTILSDDDQLATVQKVKKVLEAQNHVQPIIYLDKEIDFVTEEAAPGINSYREAIMETFADQEPVKDLHESIIGMLDEASNLFNVLIIKTDFTVPYTTVFFQLDCKYWGPEKEEEMRSRMD